MGDDQERTIDTALRAAERTYDEEEARFRHTEQKATALLAVAGVLLTVFARTFPAAMTEAAPCLILLQRILTILTILALAVAFVFGLAAVHPRQFKRITARDLMSDQTLNLSPLQVKRSLLERYSQVIEQNSTVTEGKLKSVKYGFWAVLFALLSIALWAIVGATS
jgi:predicted membrane protein